jgi:putative dimethyl sulfoxide reductase chaperone
MGELGMMINGDKSGDVMEKSAMAKGRSNVYRVLAMLYVKEVTHELLATLRSKEVAEVLKSLDMDTGHALPEVSQAVLLNDLAEEYAALFVLPGGISPYESVRLKALLFQEPSWEVEEFYKKCGLLVKESSSILPDHIGMELEFMGYLADKESCAWSENDSESALKWSDLQKDFFDSHISNWVFRFLQDFDRYAFHPFYKEVARLTRKFLEVEQDYFESPLQVKEA